MRGYLSLALGCWLLATPGGLAAQSAILQDGMHQWEELDIEGAISTFNAALRSPDISRTDAARAHAYLAALHVMLGEDMTSVAETHARISIALDRRVLPPSSAPSEVRRLFTDLRESQGESRLVFEVERQEEGGRRTVFLRADPVPEGMLVEIQVRCGDADIELAGDPAGLTFTMPTEGDIECVAQGMSSGGAFWFETRETIFEDAPLEGRRWKVWVGVVAAVAAAGAGVGLAFALRDDGTVEPDGTVPPLVVQPLLEWGGLR